MLLYKINFPVTDDIFAYNFLVSYIDIAVKLKWQCEMTMDLCFVKQPQISVEHFGFYAIVQGKRQ
jgi:hypothetical protein